MRHHIVSRMPVKREVVLAQHPELYHLQIIHETALALPNGSVLVEDGPTNGAVTYALLSALVDKPDSRLVIIGTPNENVESAVARFGPDKVTWQILDTTPSLYFIGHPERATDSVDRALEAGSRIIILYDVRTCERYRLQKFAGHAEAASLLEQCPNRYFSEVSRGISFQQCRRGMAVSESKVWVQAPVLGPNVVDISNLVKPVVATGVMVAENGFLRTPEPPADPTAEPAPTVIASGVMVAETGFLRTPEPSKPAKAKFKKQSKVDRV